MSLLLGERGYYYVFIWLLSLNTVRRKLSFLFYLTQLVYFFFSFAVLTTIILSFWQMKHWFLMKSCICKTCILHFSIWKENLGSSYFQKKNWCGVFLWNLAETVYTRCWYCMWFHTGILAKLSRNFILFTQKQPPEMFYKKAVLKNFAKFARKRHVTFLKNINLSYFFKFVNFEGSFLCIHVSRSKVVKISAIVQT